MNWHLTWYAWGLMGYVGGVFTVLLYLWWIQQKWSTHRDRRH